jgi:hypothetical protein
MPTTNAALRGAALTVAKTEVTYTSSMALGTYQIDIAPMLREQVQKGTIAQIVVFLKDKNAPVGNNRLRINSGSSSTPPSVTIVHSTPPTVTGERP